MHLGHFRSCSLPCVSRNPGLLQLYRTWEFLLHGLDKYAERAAGQLQTATHIDFAREVKVSNQSYFLPLQYVWASPEALDTSNLVSKWPWKFVTKAYLPINYSNNNSGLKSVPLLILGKTCNSTETLPTMWKLLFPVLCWIMHLL